MKSVERVDEIWQTEFNNIDQKRIVSIPTIIDLHLFIKQ